MKKRSTPAAPADYQGSSKPRKRFNSLEGASDKELYRVPLPREESRTYGFGDLKEAEKVADPTPGQPVGSIAPTYYSREFDQKFRANPEPYGATSFRGRLNQVYLGHFRPIDAAASSYGSPETALGEIRKGENYLKSIESTPAYQRYLEVGRSPSAAAASTASPVFSGYADRSIQALSPFSGRKSYVEVTGRGLADSLNVDSNYFESRRSGRLFARQSGLTGDTLRKMTPEAVLRHELSHQYTGGFTEPVVPSDSSTEFGLNNFNSVHPHTFSVGEAPNFMTMLQQGHYRDQGRRLTDPAEAKNWLREHIDAPYNDYKNKLLPKLDPDGSRLIQGLRDIRGNDKVDTDRIIDDLGTLLPGYASNSQAPYNMQKMSNSLDISMNKQANLMGTLRDMAQSARQQVGNMQEDLSQRVRVAKEVAKMVYHPATPVGRMQLKNLRSKFPGAFDAADKVRGSEAFENIVSKPVGRVIVNSREPFSYRKPVTFEQVKGNIPRIIEDKSKDYRANIPVDAKGSDPDYMRYQAYRKMFGLPADMSAFLERGDGTYDLRSEYKKQIADRLRPSDQLWQSFQEKYPNLNIDKTIRDYDDLMGSVRMRPSGNGTYSFEDRWDFDLNPGDTQPSMSNMQRWLVSKITKPMVFRGEVDTRPGAYDNVHTGRFGQPLY